MWLIPLGFPLCMTISRNFDMKKYIDADRLKAKLDEHYRNYQSKYMETRTPYTQGLIDALDLAEQVIDSFQQEQPEEPVHAELEEAADEYEKKHTYQRYDGGGLTPEYDATLAEAFIAGAKWALNQGVKATGTISPRGIIYDNNVGYHLFLKRYHYGDKVEVQIRKIE